MYPQIKYIDSDGKTEKTDMSNKYFIMFQELDVQVNQLSLLTNRLATMDFLPRGNNGKIKWHTFCNYVVMVATCYFNFSEKKTRCCPRAEVETVGGQHLCSYAKVVEKQCQ